MGRQKEKLNNIEDLISQRIDAINSMFEDEDERAFHIRRMKEKLWRR